MTTGPDPSLAIGGFEAILRALPELRVVFAHANDPWVGAAFDLLSRHPNLYLDTVHVFARVTQGGIAGWTSPPPGTSSGRAWPSSRTG